MREVVETAVFRLKDSASEAQLLRASNAFQKDFLDSQPGFLRRELLKKNDSEYVDLVHWRSAEDAAAVVERAATSAACQRYFSVMDEQSADVGPGVTHYESLALYAA